MLKKAGRIKLQTLIIKQIMVAVVFVVAILPGMTSAGSITGIVTKDSDGLPISGLWIYAYDYDTGAWSGSDYTDANGAYEIMPMFSGTYRVTVSTFGTEYIGEYYDDTSNWGNATPLSVTAGQQTGGIDFGLTVGGSITGTVTSDLDGSPIPGVGVDTWDYYTRAYRGHSVTDTNGTYEITRLPSGMYRVGVDARGTNYATEYYDDVIDWEAATVVAVISGQQTDDIDFALGPGASISGKVVNSSQQALANISINCSTNGFGTRVVSDVNGVYEFTGLPPGYVYDVAAYPPSDSNYVITQIHVDVPEANDYTGQDIILEVGALSVCGKVTEKATGSALQNIEVSCHLEDLDIWGGDAYTDVNGFYRLTNLPPGEVEIRARPVSYYAHIGIEFELTEDINDLDFALPVEAVLSGKVLDAETAEPLAGIEVKFWSDRYSVSENDYSDADGVFALTNLPPGVVEIRPRPRVETGYAWSLPWGSNWVCLGEGEHRSNRIIALQKGALVTGYIKDVNGIVVSGIKYDWEGRMCDGSGRADVNGYYQIRLPVGEHVIEHDEDDLCALHARVTITDINQPVDVNDIIVYSEQTSGQISGNVNNPSGHPKYGEFTIFALEAGTEVGPNTWYTVRPISETGLGQAGPFTISALPPDANYDVYLCVVSETLDGIESITGLDFAFNVPVGTTGINLDYNSAGSTVSGKVVNIYGRAVLGATVLLNDLATGDFTGFGRTDPNGEYVIYNVAAGTYTATAVHSKYLDASTTVGVVDGVPVDVGTIVMAFAGDKEGADLNGDGFINMFDYAKFGSQWRKSGPSEANFNQDGEVNFADLKRVAENWLWQAIWLH